MNKIRINLLPAEILEKRKAEKAISLVVVGAAGVFVLAFMVFLYFVRMVSVESGRLADLRAENSQYEQEIAKIADFENNKILVEQREQVVAAAIKKKYSFSKFLNNISLLIPNEVWIDSLSVGGAGEVKMTGSAFAPSNSRTVGQKSVAAWLVRLDELDDLADVWLENSTKVEGPDREVFPMIADPAAVVGGGAPPAATQGSVKATTDKMNFSIKGILTPLTDEAPVSSAPPASGGST